MPQHCSLRNLTIEEKISVSKEKTSVSGDGVRPPSILIDGSQFLSKTATGIGSYGRTLAASLRAFDCNVNILYGQRVKWREGEPLVGIASQVFGNTPPTSRWRRVLSEVPSLLSAAIRRSETAIVSVPLRGIELAAFDPPLPPCNHVWNADAVFERGSRRFAVTDRLLPVTPPDGVCLAHWTAPVGVMARRVPNIFTLHDMIPLQFPYFVVDRGARSAKLHRAIAQQADLIVTVSNSSKQQIMKLLAVSEDRVAVTYQPIQPLPKVSLEDAERLLETVYHAKPGQYALFVGAIEPKKNLKRLIEAFLLAAPGIPLLIVGPIGWLCDDELALLDLLADEVQKKDRPVRRLGYLPRRHVVALMQCARFFVFPSVHEGFGLPVLEAMSLGIPVLTSSTSSLPEVAGNAAVQVDPLDVSDLTRGIRRLANDVDLRAELARRGPVQAAKFTPEIYRERLAAAYAKVGVRLPMRRHDQPLLTKLPRG